MRTCRFWYYALGVCASVAMLAGCSKSQAGLPATTQQSDASEHPKDGTLLKTRSSTTTAFTVSGRQILLNGKPFFIKGVDYGTSQIDAFITITSPPSRAGTYYSAPVTNPLDNAYKGIWQKDLDLLRADGANAVKVYNVTLSDFKTIKNWQKYLVDQFPGGTGNKPSPGETGKIDEFLDAAWNGGDRPVYVVLSIQFGGPSIFDPGFTTALAEAYKIAAKDYGKYPAVMGISIGNEINDANLVTQPGWWKQLSMISSAAKDGFTEAGAQKITTTTMVDGTVWIDKSGKVCPNPVDPAVCTEYLQSEYYGEKSDFKIDAWGQDVYRGPSLGNFWAQAKRSTSKPTILSEYGAPAAYYPTSIGSTAKHGPYYSCIDYPKGTGDAPTYGFTVSRPWDFATELPAGESSNPGASYLVQYVTKNQEELFANSTVKDPANGVDAGGFYFEFSDEWWKSGWSRSHIGGASGNIIPANAQYPGCYNDEAWFGLYLDEKSGSGGEPYPVNMNRKPDTRVPRPSLNAITAEWKKDQ